MRQRTRAVYRGHLHGEGLRSRTQGKLGWEPAAGQRLQLMVNDFRLAQRGGFASVAGAGEPVQTIKACALAPGDRAANTIYPLHAGKTDSGAYRLIVFLGGIVLALLSFTGVATYLQQLTSGRRSRTRRSPREIIPAESGAD